MHSTADVDSLLGRVKTEFVHSATSSMDSIMREYDVANSQRHRRTESGLKAVEVHQTVQDSRMDNYNERLERVERELLIRASATTAEAANQQRRWNDKADPTTLRLNIHDHQLCTKDSMVAGISKWLDDGNFTLGEHVHLVGNGNSLASNWTLKFTGDEVEGDRRARKAIQCLKISATEWNQLYVRLPNGNQARIYISPDKNELQLKTEQSGKRLLEAAKAVHPGKEWHLIRRMGIVTVGWDRVALAVPTSNANTEIQWLHATADSNEIDREAVVQKFNQLSASAGVNLPWSV
jgi:hypothetical protein